jgi:hypothetical protein
MLLHRHIVGFVDPHQIDEPPENSQGFIRSNFVNILAGASGNILTFETFNTDIVLAYMFIVLTNSATIINRLALLANKSNVADFPTGYVARNAAAPMLRKLNVTIPKQSVCEFLYFNDEAVNAHNIGITVTGYRRLKP